MTVSHKMNLSFAGCGFLGIYHVGVASCFKEYAPNILVNKISGASAGSIAACCLICGCSLSQVTSDILKIATTARKYTLGPFNPKFNVVNILRDRLVQVLPADAHIQCSGRLHVSVTRVSDGQNIILSQFETKQELIQALLCSSFIPIFSGIIPEKFRGVRYIDGCYSNNLPILDENTVTVSPFCGESDICPRDNSYNLFQVNLANTSIELSPQNLYRFMRILFPPHPEILSEMCRQGFDDALCFLQRNNMISCTRCIEINSTLKLQNISSNLDCDDEVDMIPVEDDNSDEESCIDCRERRQEAVVDDLPEAVLSVLEEATLSMNSGLLNWFFKNKSMRVLSILTLPYVIPFDIAQAAFIKFKEMAPKLGEDLNCIAEWFLAYLKNLISMFSKNCQFCKAKITCQLAIQEYEYSTDEGCLKKPKQIFSASNSRRSSLNHRPRSGDYSNACPHQGYGRHKANQMMSKVNFAFSMDVNGVTDEDGASGPLVNTIDADESEKKNVRLINAAFRNARRDRLEALLSPESADTFEQALQVTHDQDAIIAYYYLDDDHQMKVRGIFDVTDSDRVSLLPPDELKAANQLEWDESSQNLGESILDFEPDYVNVVCPMDKSFLAITSADVTDDDMF